MAKNEEILSRLRTTAPLEKEPFREQDLKLLALGDGGQNWRAVREIAPTNNPLSVMPQDL